MGLPSFARPPGRGRPCLRVYRGAAWAGVDARAYIHLAAHGTGGALGYDLSGFLG
jgi:hypothetical protein